MELRVEYTGPRRQHHRAACSVPCSFLSDASLLPRGFQLNVIPMTPWRLTFLSVTLVALFVQPVVSSRPAIDEAASGEGDGRSLTAVDLLEDFPGFGKMPHAGPRPLPIEPRALGGPRPELPSRLYRPAFGGEQRLASAYALSRHVSPGSPPITKHELMVRRAGEGSIREPRIGDEPAAEQTGIRPAVSMHGVVGERSIPRLAVTAVSPLGTSGRQTPAPRASSGESGDVDVTEPALPNEETVGQLRGSDWSQKDFHHLHFTVVRIQSVVDGVNWVAPFQPPSPETVIGSGFVVGSWERKDLGRSPVFITNAHVVRNARLVSVQLPGIGLQMFKAHVPLICEDFDIAVVQIHDEDIQEFDAKIGKHNVTTQALPIFEGSLSLDLPVVAVGFPLGSQTLKLSRGEISGTEDLDGIICYQTTAPISPGSSGGPLFAMSKDGELQVVGVTFASANDMGAQNENYVVPAARIRQVLYMYSKDMGEQNRSGQSIDGIADAQVQQYAAAGTSGRVHEHGTAGMDTEVSSKPARRHGESQEATGISSDPAATSLESDAPHRQFQVAPFNAVYMEANEALYAASACGEGVFVSRILPTSVLQFAKPRPVPEKSFITSVGDVDIDRFGMGRVTAFLGDPVPLYSLLLMNVDLTEPVEVAVCTQGETSKYSVSMEWRAEYEGGVKDIFEPYHQRSALDFEVFAGVVVMELNVYHIEALARSSPQLTRFLLPENRVESSLVITSVEEGSYASRTIYPGMLVNSLNGKPVRNLEQYRAHFKPGCDAWTLELEEGLQLTVKFFETMRQQFNDAMHEPGTRYKLSPALLQWAEEYLLEHGEAASSEMQSGLETNDTLSSNDQELQQRELSRSPLGVNLTEDTTGFLASLAALVSLRFDRDARGS